MGQCSKVCEEDTGSTYSILARTSWLHGNSPNKQKPTLFFSSVGCSAIMLCTKLNFHFLMGSQTEWLFLPLRHILLDSRSPESAQRFPPASPAENPPALWMVWAKQRWLHTVSGSHTLLVYVWYTLRNTHVSKDWLYSSALSWETYTHSLCHIHHRVNWGSGGYQQEFMKPSRSRDYGNYWISSFGYYISQWNNVL